MTESRSGSRLQGKVCLVTACDLPGRMTLVEALAAEGARLVLAASSTAGVHEICERHPALTEESLVASLTVTDPMDWQRLVDDIVERFGRLDVLVQGVSAAYDQCLADTPLGHYRAVNAQNLESCFLGVKAVTGLMSEQGGGSIIHVSSVYGRIGRGNILALCASAGGLTMMSKAAALEFAQNGSGIRVNVLELRGTQSDPLEFTANISEAVIYLAGDPSAYVTGLVLPLDEGLTSLEVMV